VVPAAGHNLLLEAPADVADEIRALAVNHTNQSKQADQRIKAILAGGIDAEAGLDHLSQSRIRGDA
jgi:hypothetical protein